MNIWRRINSESLGVELVPLPTLNARVGFHPRSKDARFSASRFFLIALVPARHGVVYLLYNLKPKMQTLAFFLLAALGEISGCYAFWAWLRLGRSILWIIPGILALIIFAFVLTKVDASNAGRVYAAYGGIYILSSLVWLWLAEGVKPDLWDLLGVTISLIGTVVILFGPHRV